MDLTSSVFARNLQPAHAIGFTLAGWTPRPRSMLDALLFGGLIDHAPTFPPEELPLEEGLAEHRRVRADEHGWIVNRFVCPASKLGAPR